MRRTFKYKAKINKSTEVNADNWIELCRKLYNKLLEQRIQAYEEDDVTLSCYDQSNELPDIKWECPEYNQVGSQVLQDVIKRLDRTYKAFFRRAKNKETPGFPRFKSKYRYHSFTLKQCGWRLNNKYLTIRNVGIFKLFLSRQIEGTIKTITIKKTPTNKWFVSFSCDDVPIEQFPDTNTEVGIDVNIKPFLKDTDGNEVENPKYFRASEKLLRRRQRVLSRRKKGSIRRNNARLLVAKAHEKVTNQRTDFLHKIANYYIQLYKIIYIENLNISGMVRNKYLSKSIMDASWNMFFEFLSYKAAEAGRMVIKVNPKGTSQICSGCGERVPKGLSVRIHKCPKCGLVIDRDFNAAINIKRLGQSHQVSTSALVEAGVA